MARAVRILHLADSHIGADLPAWPRSNRRRRGDDLIASYRRVVMLAREHDVDLVIHAGDVFDTSRPSDAALAAAAEPLLALAAGGLPVVVVPGNHERSILPAALLLAHPKLHVVRQPCALSFSLRGTRVVVAAVPCMRRGAARRFGEALRETGWERAGADVNILAVHQTFESATCGPAGYRFRSGEDVVERGVVPTEMHYVAAGHIHRHQVLRPLVEGGPPIVYAGSPDRISFAERDEPKGAVLVEASAGRLTYRFLEHAVRPMAVVPLDVSGRTQAQIREEALERIAALPAEAVTLLRLSGEATRREMQGLDLARHSRAARPDVLLTVSSQAVDFVPERHRRLPGGVAPVHTGRTDSVFMRLNAPPGDVVVRFAAESKLLPKWTGTYALRDPQGRLLYVGKAKNVRARVRAHVAARSTGGFFANWTREIARIEVRRAYSELEVLLVEAELIRTLRPPFNRQMRSWSRYCYLCANGDPYGQLAICRDPVRSRTCFGPFRSRAIAEQVLEAGAAFFGLARCPPTDGACCPGRLQSSVATKLCRRYFAGVCVGPCAERVPAEEYRRRLHERDALLTGVDDAPLVRIEQELDNADGPQNRDAARPEPARQARTLRGAFAQAVMLRRAESLLGGLLLLPGPKEIQTVVLFTRSGADLDALDNDVSTARSILAKYRANAAAARPDVAGRLPKYLADCLCIAARELHRSHGAYRFVPAPLATQLDAGGLLALAQPLPRSIQAGQFVHGAQGR
jgi:exonuclease SbcD